jgi:hypothetical protein
MTPTHTRKNQRLYRYYVSQAALQQGAAASVVRRVPAAEVEAAVVDQVRLVLRSPEVVVSTWKAVRAARVTEEEVRRVIEHFDELWDQLFPAEQARIIQLLIERVEVDNDGLDIQLRAEGLQSVVRVFDPRLGELRDGWSRHAGVG